MLRCKNGSSECSEIHALDFRPSTVGPRWFSARGILGRVVGDAETPHRSCGSGFADVAGMGRASSPRNSGRGAYSFRVRIGRDCAPRLYRPAVQPPRPKVIKQARVTAVELLLCQGRRRSLLYGGRWIYQQLQSVHFADHYRLARDHAYRGGRIPNLAVNEDFPAG